MKNPLLVIPGVGKSIAADLNGIGIHRVSELKGKDPDVLYDLLNKKQGVIIDRCMLYVMRCVVYYASHDVYDPDKLKWWNWKD